MKFPDSPHRITPLHAETRSFTMYIFHSHYYIGFINIKTAKIKFQKFKIQPQIQKVSFSYYFSPPVALLLCSFFMGRC
jgi:hypothetical protein